MSLSEVTLLADFLTAFQPIESAWKIDTTGSKDQKLVTTEEGFQVLPTKSFSDINFLEYDVIVLTGNINPYPIAEDQDLIRFLEGLVDLPNPPLIAAISSSTMFLAKASVLKDTHFTSGLFEETLNEFDFFDKSNIVRQPVVFDKEKKIITAIGFAYREFAVMIAENLGYSDANRRLAGVKANHTYTEEELTFYMSPQN